MRPAPLFAVAVFAILAAGFSHAALCTDCNLVGVSIRADANEYALGGGQNINLTINIRAAPSSGLAAVGYKVTTLRPGFTTPSDITTPPFTGTTSLFPVTLTKAIAADSLQPGLYQYNIVVTSVNDGTSSKTTFPDTVISDNYATAYITVKRPTTQVPETTPLLAFAAAAGALLMISFGGRAGNRT